MRVVIHLFLFIIVKKIFIKAIIYLSNNCKNELVICLNVSLLIKFSKIELFDIVTIFNEIFYILIFRMLSVFNVNKI